MVQVLRARRYIFNGFSVFLMVVIETSIDRADLRRAWGEGFNLKGDCRCWILRFRSFFFFFFFFFF